jgi:hypothetical protein
MKRVKKGKLIVNEDLGHSLLGENSLEIFVQK